MRFGGFVETKPWFWEAKGPQASPQATPTYVFSRVWAPWSVNVKPVFHILELQQHENTWKCARSAPDTSCFHAGVLILHVFLHVLKLQQQHTRPEALGIHPEAPQRAPQKAPEATPEAPRRPRGHPGGPRAMAMWPRTARPPKPFLTDAPLKASECFAAFKFCF